MREVAEIPNYSNKNKYGFMVSQPKNYFGTMAVLNIGLFLFYGFSTNTQYWYLIVLTVLFHIGTLVYMVLLALVDPGIIPKIISEYEKL